MKDVTILLSPIEYFYLSNALRALASRRCHKSNCGTACLCASCAARRVLPHVDAQRNLGDSFRVPESPELARELVGVSLRIARAQLEAAQMLDIVQPAALTRGTAQALKRLHAAVSRCLTLLERRRSKRKEGTAA